MYWAYWRRFWLFLDYIECRRTKHMNTDHCLKKKKKKTKYPAMHSVTGNNKNYTDISWIFRAEKRDCIKIDVFCCQFQTNILPILFCTRLVLSFILCGCCCLTFYRCHGNEHWPSSIVNERYIAAQMTNGEKKLKFDSADSFAGYVSAVAVALC